jgi:hypothetical protein
MRLILGITIILLAAEAARAEELWKAGAASVQITPDKSVWLTGFQDRKHPASGKLHDLHVKALALEDADGHRAVLVTSDLLGFPAPVADRIAGEVARRFNVPRDRLVLNASHTHGAPALASPIEFIYGPRATPEQRHDVEGYTGQLATNVVQVVGDALNKLSAARLSFGQGTVGFGVNRRKKVGDQIQGFTPNPDGPVDRAVPVLRVESDSKQLVAIVFGYAAHPTTITTGPEYYQYSGDYPAVAQLALETAHPGAVAMFVEGCAGDAMVFPRGTAALAQKYGTDLAQAVDKVLADAQRRPIAGPLRSVYEKVDIAFATPPTRDALAEQLKSNDPYYQYHARAMLAILDRDKSLPKTYPYPLQVLQFGKDLTFIAMSGEVVSSYSIQFKREFSKENPVWVAAYSNDLCSYIPTRQVLADGGYEADRSMIYYMRPGPYAPSIEETIVGKTRELVKRAREAK